MPLGLEGIPLQHTSHAFPFRGGVAQSVERGSHKPYVGGSSPPAATINFPQVCPLPGTPWVWERAPMGYPVRVSRRFVKNPGEAPECARESKPPKRGGQ